MAGTSNSRDHLKTGKLKPIMVSEIRTLDTELIPFVMPLLHIALILFLLLGLQLTPNY